MSCYQVTDETHATVAIAYYNAFGGNVQTIADIFKRANIKSVNARYNERTRFTHCDVLSYDYDIGKIGMIKLIDCIMYQSCEATTWDKSDAKKMLTELQNRLMYDVITDSDEYNQAQWSL